MSVKSEQVKRGYTELTEQEKREVREFIKDFDKGNILEQRGYSEALNKSLGPKMGTGCACCGK